MTATGSVGLIGELGSKVVRSLSDEKRMPEN